MKKSLRLFIALIAATITFASLWAFSGRQNSGWNHKWHHCYYQREMKNNNADSTQLK